MGLHFKQNMLCFLQPYYFILAEIRLLISHSYDIQVTAGWHLHVTSLCGAMQEHFLRCHDSSQGVACAQGIISHAHQRNWTHRALVQGEFLANCMVKADTRDFIIRSLWQSEDQKGRQSFPKTSFCSPLSATYKNDPGVQFLETFKEVCVLVLLRGRYK